MYLAIACLIALIATVVLVRLSGIFRYIPNSRVGIVEKLWSASGSIKSGFIALNGEAGFQPNIRRGGYHTFVPFQYKLHLAPLVNVPQGELGYVYARDGQPLSPAQSLAANTEHEDFQDVQKFLSSNGQKGAQRRILREGTYAINLAQFVVLTSEKVYSLGLEKNEQTLFDAMSHDLQAREGFNALVIRGAEDKIGIVTIHDGPSMATGEIIAPEVGSNPADLTTFHNNFQDVEKFFKAGGQRGRQLQVLVEGTYYLNRLFATVEMINKTIIEVGTVGVVVSYTGPSGEDSTGVDYKHGELVPKGCRGVWAEGLLPGKYPFNTYAGKVMAVPTTNFILKWATEVTGAHKFDENLKEVTLITRDAFEPSLPLSVVVHIDYKMAPMVVQRFGDIKKLVEQTLDPMVSAYFKNIAQTKTLIELLQERSTIQKDSSEDMRGKFAAYNLELQEVLIGTPNAGAGPEGQGIEKLLMQLRDRQIAVEQVETYRLQETAAVQERSLREARATAEKQTEITQSALTIEVQANAGKATLAHATQEADTIKITADAHSYRLKQEGAGEAERIKLIGLAEAEAITSKVKAYGGPENQLASQINTRWAEAVEKGHIALVPQVQVGDSKGGGNVMEGLMAMALSDRLRPVVAPVSTETLHAV